MGKIISLKTNNPIYKYNLNKYLNDLPKALTINKILDELKKQGISRDEFYSDRKISYGSKKSMSADRLLIYSKIFDCEVSDLINHKVTATSLIDKLNKKNFKTGLKEK